MNDEHTTRTYTHSLSTPQNIEDTAAAAAVLGACQCAPNNTHGEGTWLHPLYSCYEYTQMPKMLADARRGKQKTIQKTTKKMRNEMSRWLVIFFREGM